MKPLRSIAITSLLLAACSGPPPPTDEAPPLGSDPAESASDLWLEDVATEIGVAFNHDHGGSGRRFMVETLAGGGGWIDFDADGWLDLYIVQGEPLPGHPSSTLPDGIFRNQGDGTFEDVGAKMGGAEPGYGMGFCSGDVDNDGFPDVYVTRFGADRLLRNERGERFADFTEGSGITNPEWTASCAFADYDRDGCLDLYVVNYVDFSLDNHIRCEKSGIEMYCHPDVYNGVPDRLYRGHCDATFEEVTSTTGTAELDPEEGKGLGLVWSDLDNDGLVDLYVSNDSTRNFHFRNLGDGTFQEMGVELGSAYNERGLTEAGMGVDSGDMDGDGRLDLFVAHLDFETNTFYRNQEWGLFNDTTTAAGLAAPSTTMVGFGVELFDADNDGDLDLYVANGHIIDNIHLTNPTLAFEQQDQLFENQGDARFDEVATSRVPYLETLRVGRGSPSGDLDNDGDLDLLVTNCAAPVALLRNNTRDRPGGGNSVILRLVSRHGGRDAVGSRVEVTAGGVTRVEEIRAGSGYLSQADQRIHIGLGPHVRVESVAIRWPDGTRQRIDAANLEINGVTTFVQPSATGH